MYNLNYLIYCTGSFGAKYRYGIIAVKLTGGDERNNPLKQ